MRNIPKKYPQGEALRYIKANLKNGNQIPTTHFKQRMLERKFSMQDVESVINNGKITGTPELDIKTNQWKYQIKGKTLDGVPLTIVVAFEKHLHNVLITCMRK